MSLFLFSTSIGHSPSLSHTLSILRIDGDGLIKVADFGLAVEEDNSKGYFRQDKRDGVRLPFKWMAPESLQDGVFTTKTDVVSFLIRLSCLSSSVGGCSVYE